MTTAVRFRKITFAKRTPKQACEFKRKAHEPKPLVRKDGSPVTMQNVAHDECRWIVGPPTAEARMCGHRTAAYSAYCEHHKARSHSGAA